jgi:pimeloyl-ACP methyl ester carboxylesterase
VQIEHASFQGNHTADIEAELPFNDDQDWYDQFSITDSNFEGNTEGIAVISTIDYDGATDFSGRVLLRNNWYGDASGPETPSNPSGHGEKLIGTFNLDGWSTAKHSATCTENCFSNVMFLPGIKASRLYKDGAFGTEDELWAPNIGGDDVEELRLDHDGKSIEKVYTKEDGAIEEAFLHPIYKKFLDNLKEMKEANVIQDYRSFAYDWRMNPEDIVHNGTLYDGDITRFVADDLEALAHSSKSGKVTIIAHSNGGLIGKALMMELEKRGKINMVDKIIFVGTPQMGTPLSILSLLYGFDEPIPAHMSQSEARTLAENMPGVYGLLPSKEYFSRLLEPVAHFESDQTRYKHFKDVYGDSLDSFEEFERFLSGAGDGRSEPDNRDVSTENTLREKFLDQARDMHERLDRWTPPSTVEVIQIAGWGLDTVSSVEYLEKEKVVCYPSATQIPSCMKTGEMVPYYDPKLTVDGDAVVVAPSALMMQTASNVKQYWLDLYAYNKDNPDGKHGSLFEVTSILQLLQSIIKNNAFQSTEFVTGFRPDNYDKAESRIRMSLYSPLDIHLYDQYGHHTGPKTVLIDGCEVTEFEEGIPNSYYYQFDDRKYVGFSGDEKIRVELDGYALGSYTLKIAEVNPTATGERAIAHTTFENLPTTADTKIRLSIPKTGIADISLLSADTDGDGIEDYSVPMELNGSATLDITSPETIPSLSGTAGLHYWYTSDVTLTLTATDDENGSGVQETKYSLDNGATWNVSPSPIVISSEGTTTVLYFSTDKSGNREETKTQIIKIDKTAPEAKISFNPDTQKLDIIGVDTLGGNVSVSTLESVILGPQPSKKYWYSWIPYFVRDDRERKAMFTTTLTDEAGHVTVLAFEKKKDKRNRIDLTLQSISTDGMKVEVGSVKIQYKWQKDWRGRYALLASHLFTLNTAVESHYLPRRNETWVMEKPRELADEGDDESERRPIRKKFPGVVVPGVVTEQGMVKIQY